MQVDLIFDKIFALMFLVLIRSETKAFLKIFASTFYEIRRIDFDSMTLFDSV